MYAYPQKLVLQNFAKLDNRKKYGRKKCSNFDLYPQKLVRQTLMPH